MWYSGKMERMQGWGSAIQDLGSNSSSGFIYELCDLGKPFWSSEPASTSIQLPGCLWKDKLFKDIVWYTAGIEGGEEEEMAILHLWTEGNATIFFRLCGGMVRYGGQTSQTAWGQSYICHTVTLDKSLSLSRHNVLICKTWHEISMHFIRL